IVTSPSDTGPSAVAKSTTVPPSTSDPIKLAPSTSSTCSLRISPRSPISITFRKRSSFAGFDGDTSTRHAAGTTARVFDGRSFSKSSPQNVFHIFRKYGSDGSGPPSGGSSGQFLPEPHAPPNSSTGVQNSQPGPPRVINSRSRGSNE